MDILMVNIRLLHGCMDKEYRGRCSVEPVCASVCSYNAEQSKPLGNVVMMLQYINIKYEFCNFILKPHNKYFGGKII